MKTNGKYILAGGLLLITVIVIGLVYLGNKKTEIAVEVVDREWKWKRSIVYDHVQVSVKPKSSTICYSTDNGLKCKTMTAMVPDTQVVQRTRCSDTNAGTMLPEIAPEVPCTMENNDYISDNITYATIYRPQETNEHKVVYISKRDWNDFVPGTRMRLTFNGLGILVDYGGL